MEDYIVESAGVCRLCNKEMTQRGMSRHIEMHLEKEDGLQRGARDYFHIRINGLHEKQYWLNVLAYTKASLENLDAFLRGIWLECCGHLSMFEINKVIYERQFEDDWGMGPSGEDIDVPVEKVLSKGLKFFYEYDFGSSTRLELKVVSKRRLTARTESIHLLSRNNSPEYPCANCGKKNTTHIDAYEGLVFCTKCAKKMAEKEGEEDTSMFMPLVNSPRAGVCGYVGEYDSESTYNEKDFEW